MRLKSFSVEMFRSITNARQINLGEYTVFVGPNNEGKSNLCRSLSLAIATISAAKITRTKLPDGSDFSYPPSAVTQISRLSEHYNWRRDYPVDSHTDSAMRKTQIKLEFEPRNDEIVKLQGISKLIKDGPLLFQFEYGEGTLSLGIFNGQTKLQVSEKEMSLICELVLVQFRFIYVPAIRTTKQTQDILERLIENDMALLKNNKRYLDALKLISEIEDPVLEKIGQNITATIQKFIPTIRNIKIEAAARNLQFNRHATKFWIEVDDGIATPIDQKGDGIKSLISLALMRDQSAKKHDEFDSLIAIEEPEAHLHPSAIRELRHVVQEISSTNQVIVSTHSPLFAQLEKVEQNILIKSSSATTAKSFSEIRQALGVSVSDNLSSAELVLLVEGANDIRTIKALIENRSDLICVALANGRLALKEMGGASSLAYHANIYQSGVCMIHAFVDNDDEGRNAVKVATEKKFISEKDYNLATLLGYNNSELEDLLSEDAYAKSLFDEFGIDLARYQNVEKREKWSKRMEHIFTHSGKVWSDSLLSKIKNIVSRTVVDSPQLAIHPKLEEPINAMIVQVESKLRGLSKV